MSQVPNQKPSLPMSSAKPLPTVRMVGSGGEIVVNKTDQAHYEAQGYKIKVDKPSGGCPNHDWKVYDLEQLRKHATDAKIKFTEKATEDNLRDLLCKSGYVPPVTE